MTEPSPWNLVYNTARRLSMNRPIDADVVALVMLLDAKGPMHVIKVARALSIGAATASELSDKAAALGLVGKRRDPGNKRATVVHITLKAYTRLRRVWR